MVLRNVGTAVVVMPVDPLIPFGSTRYKYLIKKSPKNGCPKNDATTTTTRPDNPLTSCRTDGGKNVHFFRISMKLCGKPLLWWDVYAP